MATWGGIFKVPVGQILSHREGFESSKALADHLRIATRRNHGTAIRDFLDQLCRLQEADILNLERRKVAWARSHMPRGADSQVGRVVDRFALVALAGEMAAEWRQGCSSPYWSRGGHAFRRT